jgi:Transglutaminase-like superfamily
MSVRAVRTFGVHNTGPDLTNQNMTTLNTGSQSSIQASARLWIAITTSAVLTVAVLLMLPAARGRWRTFGHLRHAVRSHHLAFIATAFIIVAGVCVYLLSQMVVVKAKVHESCDPLEFSARRLPEFVQQNRSSKALVEFRRHFGDILSVEYPDSLSKAVAIRHWVRRQQSQDRRIWSKPAKAPHEDPRRLLEEQRSGIPGSCRRFCYILTGALLSAGFDARVVSFTGSLFRRGAGRHVVVEVLIEELHKWILLDPTFDTLVLVDGRLASALELNEAVVGGRLDAITFERNGSSLAPHPKPEIYGHYCRHLFMAMSNAIFDGYSVRFLGRKRISFLHYSREAAYPRLRKQLLLGAGGSGVFLSIVFWAWTLLSLIPD